MLGGALARCAGERVICVARPDTAAAIAETGLTLVTTTVRRRCGPRRSNELREPVDLLLVTVKAPALDDAISRIEAEPGLVLPLLNGLEHMDAIRSAVSRTSLAATIGRFEGYLESADADRAADAGRRERRRRRRARAARPVGHRHARRRE